MSELEQKEEKGEELPPLSMIVEEGISLPLLISSLDAAKVEDKGKGIEAYEVTLKAILPKAIAIRLMMLATDHQVVAEIVAKNGD